jgi:hypothetical protein
MTRYAVFRLDADNVQQERMGEIDLDKNNDMQLVSAEGEAKEEILEAMEELNGKPVLFIKGPPESDAPKFSINKTAVERTAPNFLDALQDNLKRWHNMVLVAQ